MCMGDGKIRVGIGFATGRRSFQKVLKTYVYNLYESGLVADKNIHLSLFVAYDLKYSNTLPADYTNIKSSVRDLLDDVCFVSDETIQKDVEELLQSNVISSGEVELFFGHGGYASKRNALLYAAIKSKMDYLLFLDDDEYPVAVTNSHSTAVWGGQEVLATHLKYIQHADITNGHHCGYISPIPYVEFNDTLKEEDFRFFIEAISNDIINWETIQTVMRSGGITYADKKILMEKPVLAVPEVRHTKFISGSNLCINLKNPNRVNAFYNPPGARGEDTFLSTCLSDRDVLRIPCYTFHDGFSAYHHLMDGVLPTHLRPIRIDSDLVINRFYRACVGWIRYKPLLLYITQRESYSEKIEQMKARLNATLPGICTYFGKKEFRNIRKELELYHKNVENHYASYIRTQEIWSKMVRYLSERDLGSKTPMPQRAPRPAGQREQQAI